MDPVQRLEAIEAIKVVKARYCRYVDTRQWDALRGLFAETATFEDRSGAMGPVAGLDQFLLKVRDGLDGCVSVHHVHAAEIELTSPAEAAAIWAMEDRLQWAPGSRSPVRSLHGMGHYVESLACLDGKWLITSWTLSRLRVDMVPA